jgi:hypothetical protein
MIVSDIRGITTHFTFMSQRGRAEERVLIDSGATKNFLGHHMVKQLGIGTRQLLVPRRIFNVDSMENIAGRLTRCCTLHIRKGELSILQMFYITTLGADRTILGYPWLKAFNPHLDWREGKILGPGIQIETCGLKKHRAAAWRRVLDTARRDPVWEDGDEVIIMAMSAHTSQQWAIEANKCK